MRRGAGRSLPRKSDAGAEADPDGRDVCGAGRNCVPPEVAPEACGWAGGGVGGATAAMGAAVGTTGAGAALTGDAAWGVAGICAAGAGVLAAGGAGGRATTEPPVLCGAGAAGRGAAGLTMLCGPAAEGKKRPAAAGEATTGRAGGAAATTGRCGTGAAWRSCSARSTSPGFETRDRSILGRFSGSRRAPGLEPRSLPPRVSAPRTRSASSSSSELECVFFSVTPTAVSTSRMALLFTSSSRARSLIRTLLIRPFICHSRLHAHWNLGTAGVNASSIMSRNQAFCPLSSVRACAG